MRRPILTLLQRRKGSRAKAKEPERNCRPGAQDMAASARKHPYSSDHMGAPDTVNAGDGAADRLANGGSIRNVGANDRTFGFLRERVSKVLRNQETKHRLGRRSMPGEPSGEHGGETSNPTDAGRRRLRSPPSRIFGPGFSLAPPHRASRMAMAPATAMKVATAFPTSRRSFRNTTPIASANTMLVSRSAVTSAIGAWVKAHVTIE